MTHSPYTEAAIMPLKRKYRCYKPVKKTKVHGDHNQKAKKKMPNPPKTYEYGSRVMVLLPNGKVRMVDGNPADYRRGAVK